MANLFQLVEALFHERSARRYIRIEIESHVFDRISNAVKHSNVEEGGKLIGYYKTNSRDSLTLKVLSYIDSGPGVDNSQTHLHPDGEYQEAAFRLVESYEPEVEHLGSWHSHHCNGLSDLSAGDIRGYVKSVNNPDYNIGIFLAILAYGSSTRKLQHRYYIFQKGRNEYLEVPKKRIAVVPSRFPLDEILRQQERLSFEFRDKMEHLGTHAVSIRHYEDIVLEEELKQIRAEDAKKIREIYPDAEVVHDTRDGTIYWRWPMHDSRTDIVGAYFYPSGTDTRERLLAEVRVSLGNKAILSDNIELNNGRFDRIASLMCEAEDTIAKTLKEEQKERHTENRPNRRERRNRRRPR